MIHLREISFAGLNPADTKFPFNLPIVQATGQIRFDSDVTFFVGENGSGKSTILETIACAADLPTIGSQPVATDPTLEPMRRLARHVKWSWNKRIHRGFFMRSEDFFGYTHRIDMMIDRLGDDRSEIEQELASSSQLARDLATGVMSGQIAAVRRSYGDGLDVQSHGESYFKLFRSRFVPDGIYLLDEPEAPLSPMRQLSLLTMLKMMVEQGAQFIIATHSPIILAYPGATILSFDGQQIQRAEYESLEHVTITRDFLNNPDAFLRHLMT